MTSSQYELVVKDNNNNGFAPRKITSVTLTVNEFEYVPREATTEGQNMSNGNESDFLSDPYTNPNGLPY